MTRLAPVSLLHGRNSAPESRDDLGSVRMGLPSKWHGERTCLPIPGPSPRARLPAPQGQDQSHTCNSPYSVRQVLAPPQNSHAFLSSLIMSISSPKLELLLPDLAIWLISAKRVTSPGGSCWDTHLSLNTGFLHCKPGRSISESCGSHELM